MSLATLLDTRLRRAGRPAHADDPRLFRRRVLAAAERLLRRRRLKEIAAERGISVRTLQLWISEVLISDHPAARALRRKVAQSRN